MFKKKEKLKIIFFTNERKYILAHKEDLIKCDAPYFHMYYELKKISESYGTYDNIKPIIRVNLQATFEDTKNESEMIMFICRNITHETLHHATNKDVKGYHTQESMVHYVMKFLFPE